VRLYILRHGPAEDHASTGRDFDRALTPAGRERVRSVARALREADEMPEVIVSSPLVRAIQTAEIVAAAAGKTAAVEVRGELSPGTDARPLVREKVAANAPRVMLVGHEPDLTDLVDRLTGRQLTGGFQKAMVVGLAPNKDAPRASGPSGASITMRVRFVLDPKSLEWHYDTP
jgi:phosphohistidine phosphatase